MPYPTTSDGHPWSTFRIIFDASIGQLVAEYKCYHGEWQSKCFRCIVDRKAQPRGHYVNREQGV